MEHILKVVGMGGTNVELKMHEGCGGVDSK